MSATPEVKIAAVAALEKSTAKAASVAEEVAAENGDTNCRFFVKAHANDNTVCTVCGVAPD